MTLPTEEVSETPIAAESTPSPAPAPATLPVEETATLSALSSVEHMEGPESEESPAATNGSEIDRKEQELEQKLKEPNGNAKQPAAQSEPIGAETEDKPAAEIIEETNEETPAVESIAAAPMEEAKQAAVVDMPSAPVNSETAALLVAEKPVNEPPIEVATVHPATYAPAAAMEDRHEEMVHFAATRRAIEEAALSIMEDSVVEEQVQLLHVQSVSAAPHHRVPARDPRLLVPKAKRTKLYAAKAVVTLDQSSPGLRRKKQAARKSTGADEMTSRGVAKRSMPMILKGEMTSNYESAALNKMPKSYAYKHRDAASETEAKAKQHKKRKSDSTPKSAKSGDAKKAKKEPSAKKPPGSGEKREAPVEVFMGEPDEPIDGGWPKGWIKRTFERQGGSSKGQTDRYWYSPVTNKKFRSMVEIKRFLAALQSCGGDEDQAWRMFKAK